MQNMKCDCGCGKWAILKAPDGQQFHSPACARDFYGKDTRWRLKDAVKEET